MLITTQTTFVRLVENAALPKQPDMPRPPFCIRHINLAGFRNRMTHYVLRPGTFIFSLLEKITELDTSLFTIASIKHWLACSGITRGPDGMNHVANLDPLSHEKRAGLLVMPEAESGSSFQFPCWYLQCFSYCSRSASFI